MGGLTRKPALMIQATGSNAGKSIFCAGLCRAFKKRGLKPVPFKPQNMSNNAAPTMDGGEIGRAQALQAQAAGINPSIHMNPVLLKPESERGAQIIVQGKMQGHKTALEYYAMKKNLLPIVTESFHILEENADIMIIEGAGSPAEINLRRHDIANMGFAEALLLPVILLADIDRGGVIASILGTYHLLTPLEKKLLCGYIINKFRGDPELFTPAHHILFDRTGLENFGTLPWMPFLNILPKEDSASMPSYSQPSRHAKLHIIVPHFPRIANFNDFDPLLLEPDIALTFLQAGQALPSHCDLVILPGSKSVVSDLTFMRQQGWDIDILAHARRGGGVLGICGGYQMMGKKISDPKGIEGPKGTIDGLGLLDVTTLLTENKTLTAVTGHDIIGKGKISGYEMHIGKTEGLDCQRAMLKLEHPHKRPEGARAKKEGIMGCYIHGLFDDSNFRHNFLSHFTTGRFDRKNTASLIENTLDLLAEQIEQHCCLDNFLKIAEKARK